MTEFEREQVRISNENIYALGFCILAFKSYVVDSSILLRLPEFVDSILIVMFCACMVYKLATQSYTIGQVMLLSVLGIGCLYTCPKVDNYYLIFSFFGIAGMQNVELKKVIKWTSWVKASIILVHVSIYFVNLFLDPSSIVYVYREDGVPRHFFYMGHANTFSGYLLWTTLQLIYVYYEKMQQWHFILAMAVNWFFYLYTDSNTSFAMTILIIGILMLKKAGVHSLDRWIRLAARYLFLFASVIFAASCVFYTSMSGGVKDFYEKANSFFTGRLRFGAYVYDTASFSLFGRSIQFPPKIQWREFWLDSMVFDNAYIWMFVLGGAIYLVLISYAMIRITRYTDFLENVMLVAYAMYGISEAYIINAGNCFPLLLVGVYLYRRKQDMKGKGMERKGERAYERIKHNYSSL